MPSRSAEQPKKMSQKWAWVLLAAALLFAACVRIRLLQIPFERDEGEFAYMGQLMLHGIPPYKIAFNMKMPGIYAFYALMMAVFGQTVGGVHFGFMLVNLASIVLLFLLVRRVFGALAGGGAAATYSVLSVHSTVLGTSAHATHFVVLFALAGMLLTLKAVESKRSGSFFLSGVLFGLAFLMKQPGGVLGVMAFVYAAWYERKERSPWTQAAKRLGSFILGGMVPLVLTVLLLWRAGVLKDFFFWTFTYLKTYASQVPIAAAPVLLVRNFSTAVMVGTWPLYLAALIGLLLIFADKNLRKRAGFAVGFLVMSFVAVCPGFYFRFHYFILLLPAVAMLAGVALSWGAARVRAGGWTVAPALASIALFAAALGYVVYSGSEFFFRLTPTQACSRMYLGNNFETSQEIAKYIRNHTTDKDKIAVVGSEPQIYFHARRRAAVSYIYMYPLMEANPFAHKMQRDLIRQIETSRPKYLVYAGSPTSWLRTEKSDTLLHEWLPDWLSKHYSLVGLTETLSADWIQSYWDEDAADRAPLGPYFTLVLVRKEP